MPGRTFSLKSWQTAAAVLLFAAIAVVGLQVFDRDSAVLDEAWSACQRGNPEQALERCRPLLLRRAPPPDARAIAGQCLFRRGDVGEALQQLQQLPFPPESDAQYFGQLTLADCLEKLGRVSDSRDTLLRLNRWSGNSDVAVLRRLAGLDAGVGCFAQAKYWWTRLLQLGHARPQELVRLAAGQRRLWSMERLQRLRQLQPHDPLLSHAVAMSLWLRHRPDAAIRQLLSGPGSPECTGLLIQLAVERVDLVRMSIGPSLSAEAWLSLSVQAESSDLWNAVSLAWRALREDPDSVAVHRGLERLLLQLGFEELAAQFRQRADILSRLQKLCRHEQLLQTDQAQLAAQLLGQLGRQDELVAWCRAALRLQPSAAWPMDMLNRHRAPLTEPQCLPLSIVPDFVDPEWFSADVRSVVERMQSGLKMAAQPRRGYRRLQLTNVAQARGIRSVFHNGRQARSAGRRMHEVTGGGVGVIDLDGDSWPDLWLAQGADQPRPDSPKHDRTDHLLRNKQGQSFCDVSERAGLSPAGFGQGVAVGDINNDGFPDVYAVSCGRNTVWLNQGDGTFQAQTIGEPVWTISAAIADLNGDSVPDLYDVNYVGGDDVFERLCDHDGQARICSPRDFPAESDVVHFGRLEGGFSSEEVARVSRTSARPGMGVVVDDFLQTGGMQVLVANDETANQFLEVSPEGQLEDSATVRGLTTGREGTAQGSMGIAVGQLQSDGGLALFITNYYGESNCLHVQTPDGFFPDRITQRRLDQPGRAMLGFGTQFLDVDCDGDDDLFVANGHLDDFQHQKIPYHMRPQLFDNQDGVFCSVPGDEGDFLQTPALGRAVAVLDYNRDLRPDLCVTDLEQPVALLENRTPRALVTLALRVCGTQAARDAVGTRVQVSCADVVSGRSVTGATSGPGEPVILRKSVRAGDGYACSGSKLLRFAVPADWQRIRISWGNQTQVMPVPDREGPRAEYVLVLGQPGVWSVPR